jgi:thymidine kinase
MTVIVGPMFSGKTTEMLRRLERYSLAGKDVVLIRPKVDTRSYLAHSKIEFDGDRLCCKDLNQMLDILDHYHVIGIDEGQMFPEIAPYITEASLAGKHIILSALNMTSEGKPFEQVSVAMHYADELIKLAAVCTVCGSEYATMSYYKGIQAKTVDLLVGGPDLYEARCFRCWQDGMKNQKNTKDEKMIFEKAKKEIALSVE